MQFMNSVLPWTDAPVRENTGLGGYLRERLPVAYRKYLPEAITLFVDHEVSESAVSRFLEGMAEHLRAEMDRRMARQRRFVSLGLLSEDEVEAFLTGRTSAQPWALYFSTGGGLGTQKRGVGEANRARGVIPCSTMQNHGVAWEQADNGRVRIWLATARREGCDWDWESDIGHESGTRGVCPGAAVRAGISPDRGGRFVRCRESKRTSTGPHYADDLFVFGDRSGRNARGESRNCHGFASRETFRTECFVTAVG